MIKETIIAVIMSCSYNSNYDGDTVKIHCPTVPFQKGISYTGNVRIKGVDTPEMRGKCVYEKAKARSAKVATKSFLMDQRLTVNYYGVGKYGRPIVDIIVGDSSLADYLVDSGIGRYYDGGKRGGWCE